MTTGEKLSSLRKQNNYTQEELADMMNVSRQSVSRWESDIAFPEKMLYDRNVVFLAERLSEND